MTLVEYILKHSERGSCRCERCIDAPNRQVGFSPVEDHAVNLVFFDVAKVDDPSATELLDLLRSHRGDFTELEPLDGKIHSYIELGAWIGDQGLALRLMGLGVLLGLWKLVTPSTILGYAATPEMSMRMAGAGLIGVQRVGGV